MTVVTTQGVPVQSNTYLTKEQAKALVARLEKENPNYTIHSVNVTKHGASLNYECEMNPKPVEHIRRITGYLVGTLDKFNDAKKAEEKDRVKHV